MTTQQLVMERVAGFAALLRDHDYTVSPEDLSTAFTALAALDLRRRDALYEGLRVTLVKRPDEWALFDELYRTYWRGSQASQLGDEVIVEASQRNAESGQPESNDAQRTGAVAWSPDHVEADRDREVRGPLTRQELRRLVRQLTDAGPWMSGWRRVPGRGREIDLRRTLRLSYRAGGEPVVVVPRRRRPQQRRLTFICDVSRSMTPYSEPLLQLAHAALLGRRRVEAYGFATRLTRLTPFLRARDPEAALTTACTAVADWSGGTRIGDALEEIGASYSWSIRGGVVVIASDGWDFGEAAKLERAAERLRRLAHSIIWLNPHVQDPAYAPLTGGMRAVLPHVDHLVSCHNYESFKTFLAILNDPAHGSGRS